MKIKPTIPGKSPSANLEQKHDQLFTNIKSSQKNINWNLTCTKNHVEKKPSESPSIPFFLRSKLHLYALENAPCPCDSVYLLDALRGGVYMRDVW